MMLPKLDVPVNLPVTGLNLRALKGTSIFRTGDVTRIDTAGAQRLRAIGVRHYIDLRTAPERKRYGDADSLNAAGITTLRIPIAASNGCFIAARNPRPDEYARYYVAMLRDMKPAFAHFFAAVQAFEGAPFLFGCHAGKDRTGLLAMLLLSILGADRDAIVRDYEASADYLLAQIERFRDKWERKGETREEYAVRLRPQGETMIRVLAELNVTFGGAASYLERCGVTQEQQRIVRALYITSSRHATR
jgi:protein-tyrosine phosphatase